MTAATKTYERVNISLPRDTLELLDRVTAKGSRSRFIDHAIRERIASIGRAKLRKRLAQGYAARVARDRSVVEDWFVVEEEAWQRHDARQTRGRR